MRFIDETSCGCVEIFDKKVSFLFNTTRVFFQVQFNRLPNLTGCQMVCKIEFVILFLERFQVDFNENFLRFFI